jgi:hypothetical protein
MHPRCGDCRESLRLDQGTCVMLAGAMGLLQLWQQTLVPSEQVAAGRCRKRAGGSRPTTLPSCLRAISALLHINTLEDAPQHDRLLPAASPSTCTLQISKRCKHRLGSPRAAARLLPPRRVAPKLHHPAIQHTNLIGFSNRGIQHESTHPTHYVVSKPARCLHWAWPSEFFGHNLLTTKTQP